MKRALFAALALALAGCEYTIPSNTPVTLGGFQVTVLAVSQPSSDVPADVVQTCVQQHGGTVPPELRGTLECPYAIATGQLDFKVRIVAYDTLNQPMPDLSRPVSFQVAPGDLATDYAVRWTQLTNGAATATVRANHLFGDVQVWVQDAPPQPILENGVVKSAGLPVEPDGLTPQSFPRTYATGLSQVLRFEEPTLAKIQRPQVFDNTNYGAPFTNQFVTVGRNPTAGSQILENCPDDPLHNGTPVAMVVTGIDAAGFFATDVNSCRIREQIYQREGSPPLQLPEPDGFFPGTFGAIYVYNYNHPDSLDVGDLLFSIAGSVQEFTSTTQITFASWSVAERVRELPQDQWNKYLDLVPIHDINARTCGLTDLPDLADTSCGYYKQGLKFESLESTLVRARDVKLPDTFANCDKNADGQVTYFCDYTASNGTRQWGQCGTFAPPSGPDGPEIQCYIDCSNTAGPYARTQCTELTELSGFNQLNIELASPGPAAAGLDESISSRAGEVVTAALGMSARTASAYPANAQLRLFCDAPVYYRLGDAAVVADATGTALAANTLGEVFVDPGQGTVAFAAQDGASAAHCTVSMNPHTKILTTLADALPDLELMCNLADPDPDLAQQCQWLHGARYDFTGHLRQVQPARPRWMILPRDPDDICCRPGPGMQCPRISTLNKASKPIATCN